MTIITLLVPILLPSWKFVDISLDSVNISEILVLVASGLIGFGVGAYIYIKPYATGSSVPLPPKFLRSSWKALYDLLAYDLYVQAIYKYTVV